MIGSQPILKLHSKLFDMLTQLASLDLSDINTIHRHSISINLTKKISSKEYKNDI